MIGDTLGGVSEYESSLVDGRVEQARSETAAVVRSLQSSGPEGGPDPSLLRVSGLTFYRWKRCYDPQSLSRLPVDGGSDFAAVFGQAYRKQGLRLFVLCPRSTKLNGQAERANRAHTEEFYEPTACSLPIAELNRELQARGRTYNTVPPHQGSGLSPPRLAQTLQPHRGIRCAFPIPSQGADCDGGAGMLG
jgi:hypothetical protein